MTSRTGSSPVLSGAEAQAAVRPANLDRPLHRGTIDPQYSDPRLEEMIRATAERAREEAQAQGYLAGWSQGRQAAAEENVRVQARLQEENQKLRAQLTVEAQQLLENLRDATRQVQQATLPQWNEVSDILTDGACASPRRRWAGNFRQWTIRSPQRSRLHFGRWPPPRRPRCTCTPPTPRSWPRTRSRG